MAALSSFRGASAQVSGPRRRPPGHPL